MPSVSDWQGLSAEELAARSRHGDKAAFGELVRRQQRTVLAIAYRMSGDPMLAEDIAQNTFLQAWQRLARFQDRGPGSFRAWLCRMAYNATIDQLRKSRATVPLEGLPIRDETGSAQSLVRRDEAQIVREAVLALPDACRAALILREYEGLSYREIAAVLDIPIGTVMSRLNYARTKLRQKLLGARLSE